MNCNLDTLKKLCRFRRIKYTKLKKQEIINLIIKYNATRKIQQFYRKIKINTNVCPISMSSIRYPYYPFRPKGQTIFVYYNLTDIIDYLISTGEFRDPKTRQEYSNDDLKLIETLRLDHKISDKSILVAKKKVKFYKQKKELEDDVLVIERCLDDIISSMRTILENSDRRKHAVHTLNNLLFMSFRVYFRRLVTIDRDSARAVLMRSMDSINQTVDRSSTLILCVETNSIRDNIIQFFYQVQFDELEV